jgi:phosphate:Na+ symporter
VTAASAFSAVLGGLGLFLVGMWLMTDGLKLAAGESLRDLLRQWTDTRMRGLTTGFMITAAVQHSGAVTVAAIGFVNAGLLTLQQAIWVVFGSNVGTTMTGWIVALIGLRIEITAFALPLIGLGMIIRLTGARSRRAAFGQAIVGFGLFFLGIAVLKDAFIGLADGYRLPDVADARLSAMAVYVLIGFVLTTLMQSSSAAMVITLGAAAGGMIPLAAAAAVVIGANLGSTSTALFSVWGATATAKRVAAAHVAFNLLAAAIALIIITPLLHLTGLIRELLQLDEAPAVTLALFHTVFNVLGIVLIWPLANRLVARLNRMFTAGEQEGPRPRYLDDNVLEVPALAASALLKEIGRYGAGALRLADIAILSARPDPERLQREEQALASLGASIGDFIGRMGRTNLPHNIAEALPQAVRVINYYNVLTDLAVEFTRLHARSAFDDVEMSRLLSELRQTAAGILQAGAQDPGTALDGDTAERELEVAYEAFKFSVLKAGSAGRIGMAAVDAQLARASLIRRIGQQALKARRHGGAIQSLLRLDADAQQQSAAESEVTQEAPSA